QVGNILRGPPVADAAQEIARRSGSLRVGAEEQMSLAAHPKLDAVVGLQLVADDTLAVDVGAVLAVLVLDEIAVALAHDHGVVARDPRVQQGEVFIRLAADGKRRALQHKAAPLLAHDEYQRGPNGASRGCGCGLHCRGIAVRNYSADSGLTWAKAEP